MKKILVLCFILFGVTSWNAEGQGIRFWEGSFKEALQTAKQQNKLVFIDFYTAWCGPCKTLSNHVFPLPEVGTYFNKNFVSCKLDAEREGKELAKKYGVTGYPTLLFIDTDGNVINRGIGYMDADGLILAGKKAIGSINDRDNVTNLKKRYLSGIRDEQFLRMYVEKMVEYKDYPYEAFDEYLKIQASMQEDSPEMMRFLMKYSKCFMLGGESERIFLANQDVYMKLANREEKRSLSVFYVNVLQNTQKIALRSRDVRQYELFVDRWLKLPEKPYGQSFIDLELKLLFLKGDEKNYCKLAIGYLDSIVGTRSVENIHEYDKKYYESYCQRATGQGAASEALKHASKDMQARAQTEVIWNVGRDLVKIAKDKDLKHFPKWIEYGKQLLPESYQMMDLEAGLLYRQGKKEEAIELKRKVLGLVNPRNKVTPRVEEELSQMEKSIF